MISVQSLHDAVLIKVEIEWQTGNALLLLRMHINGEGSKEIELHCLNFESVIIPRKLEWGKSSSINEAKIEHVQNALIIEMQSGDVINIKAEKFSFEKR